MYIIEEASNGQVTVRAEVLKETDDKVWYWIEMPERYVMPLVQVRLWKGPNEREMIRKHITDMANRIVANQNKQ